MTLFQTKNSAKDGQNAEAFAVTFLQQSGLKLLIQNYSSPFGEIDIIAQENNTLIFVEVRLRTHTRYGTGFESVNLSKQKKIIKTAQFYLQQEKIFDNLPCRFDIVSLQAAPDLTLTIDEQIPPVWIKNAFQTE